MNFISEYAETLPFSSTILIMAVVMYYLAILMIMSRGGFRLKRNNVLYFIPFYPFLIMPVAVILDSFKTTPVAKEPVKDPRGKKKRRG